MSDTRVNPFENIDAAPTFTTKPRATKPVDADVINQLSRDNNFPSRQPPRPAEVVPAAPPRKRRPYKTGRNQQLNFKATAATADRFYDMAEKRHVKLCELLEQALDALEKADEAQRAPLRRE